ncbi:MAG: endonuclease III [Methanosarcinaceae archaeon]|nr:endonuclease III [Methanosarcinaceae archaeon]MDD4331775.1 endonuclease III [Methanosarcinaceae archaeon]MDD4748885.1 endonuclease III [Methanosarcinaceae archaeon]
MSVTKPEKSNSSKAFFPLSEILEKRQHFDRIWTLLKKEYPNPKPGLNYKNPLELLLATILSAQCTDAQVNKVTENLFKKYKSVEAYASADPKELEKEIYSVGFYRQKAKNIIRTAQLLLEKYDSKVPETMEELISLPGVGRKTANIVLARGFGHIEGIAVDTHVKRLSKRLGFTEQVDPIKIERELIALAKKEELDALSMTLILHGRKVCKARRPKCAECLLKQLCPSSRL